LSCAVDDALERCVALRVFMKWAQGEGERLAEESRAAGKQRGRAREWDSERKAGPIFLRRR